MQPLELLRGHKYNNSYWVKKHATLRMVKVKMKTTKKNNVEESLREFIACTVSYPSFYILCANSIVMKISMC